MPLLAQNIWKIFPADIAAQQNLCRALNISPAIAQLLINRGLAGPGEAQRFLSGNLNDLHDPFLLAGMKPAVNRILQAKAKGEKVLIHGDYDVDGVTSTVLLSRALRKIGVRVAHHIPHRLNDGYGINAGIVDVVKEQDIDLVVSVDCGITANQEIALLNAAGVEAVVIDHHEPIGTDLPPAVAVVDPKRHDCRYPFKHLAAVGLVIKFIQALTGKVEPQDLELAALGTIADVVPLTDENRIFVKAGLPYLAATSNCGLSALMEVAGIKGKKLRPYSIGFVLGPRINATGRMDSAHKSLDLLLAEDAETARVLAEDLDALNTQRQKLQRDIFQEALAMIEREVNFKEHKVIVLSREGWHRGVLGIVASKVSEMFSRPAVIISTEDGLGTASARSIAGFHLNEALADCAEILEGYGGHKFAAGLTILPERINEFRDRINSLARATLAAEDLAPRMDIDCELALKDLNLRLIEDIEKLEPYGEGNPPPLFCAQGVTVKGKPMVCARDTIKLWLTDGKVNVSAVGFGMAKFKEFLSPGAKIDVAYELIIDDWNKAPTVQLKLKDIREA